MRKLFLATGFLFLCGYVFGQAKEGTMELQKTVAPQLAVLIYLPYSPDVVKKALSNYLAKSGVQAQKEAKGYLLSSNTLLVKTNKTGADMNFAIDRRDPQKKNESAIYLKLNSFSKNEMGENASAVQQEAKDYLDNLAVAIKPYASAQQLKLQRKDLADARAKSKSLVDEGNKLELARKKIQSQIGENENYRKDKRLARRKIKNAHDIQKNSSVRASLHLEINRQAAALALLSN
jgi:hypothetical protein